MRRPQFRLILDCGRVYRGCCTPSAIAHALTLATLIMLLGMFALGLDYAENERTAKKRKRRKNRVPAEWV